MSKDYIYAYVDNAVDVYDFQGQKVDSIANGVSYIEYYYGDDRFLFATWILGTLMTRLATLHRAPHIFQSVC